MFYQKALSETRKGSDSFSHERMLVISVLEGRNFQPRALRSEMLRSAKFYCHISLEDQNTHEVLYSVKTRKAQKDPNHSISWAEDVLCKIPPNKRTSDVKLIVNCFERGSLHDHSFGELCLPLDHVEGKTIDQWFMLTKKSSKKAPGEIHLIIEMDDQRIRPQSFDGGGERQIVSLENLWKHSSTPVQLQEKPARSLKIKRGIMSSLRSTRGKEEGKKMLRRSSLPQDGNKEINKEPHSRSEGEEGAKDSRGRECIEESIEHTDTSGGEENQQQHKNIDQRENEGEECHQEGSQEERHSSDIDEADGNLAHHQEKEKEKGRKKKKKKKKKQHGKDVETESEEGKTGGAKRRMSKHMTKLAKDVQHSRKDLFKRFPNYEFLASSGYNLHRTAIWKLSKRTQSG